MEISSFLVSIGNLEFDAYIVSVDYIYLIIFDFLYIIC